MNTLYTFGYAKAAVDDLQKLVQEKDWWLVDIRMNPRSRLAQWNMKALKETVGANYVHVPAFGNKNYKSGGAIELANPDEGLRVVASLLESKPAILMCACSDLKKCHRLVAADYAAARLLVAVIHLTLESVQVLLMPKAEPTIGLTDIIQLGMPGIGEDRVAGIVIPKQMSLL